MHTGLLSRMLFLRARCRNRDGWDSARIAGHRQRELADLRRAAYAGSEFYRRHHRGLFRAPLAELPPVTKAELMGSFDQAVTAPGLRLAGLEAHLQALVSSGTGPARPWRGRWWVAATAGTTGRRGIFVWNTAEWSAVLASYARANDWAGVPAGIMHPLRVAVVSSLFPTHQSAVVGASLSSPLVPTLRLDATAPPSENVAALNAFQPRLLVGYASELKPLAAEQREGRLAIAPQSVMSASEVLTDQTATEITAAWGSAPFNVYAATETAGIASPCVFRRSHLYEDLVIVEPVDAGGNPVPAGTAGSRLLVTVLFARTLPLIRYELSDRIVIGGRGCPCGRSFALLEAVEGRAEDVVLLPGAEKDVRVHPNVFHNVLDEAWLTGWQVVQERRDRLRILVTGPGPAASEEDLEARLRSALARAGAVGVHVRVRRVESIPRTALGKTPLVRTLHGTDNGAPGPD